MSREQKIIVCRDGGADCDWEARDSDETELLATAQGHAQRKHAARLAPEQIRPLMRAVARGVGGI